MTWDHVDAEDAEQRYGDLGLYRVDLIQTTRILRRLCWREVVSVAGLFVGAVPSV
jgi:hypothetical protein